MNQGFSQKCVKCEIPGRRPGRDGREAVGWKQLKIEVEREEIDISGASAILDSVCMLFNIPLDLDR